MRWRQNTMNSKSSALEDSLWTERGSSYIEKLHDRSAPIGRLEEYNDPGTECSLSVTRQTPQKSVTGNAYPFLEGIRGLLTKGHLHKKPRRRFIALQKWEGTVIELENGIIRAEIRDLMRREQAIEEITFSFEDISQSERSLVLAGAVFYWTIGYVDTATGQRKRESTISFRRLPAWRRSEIEAVKSASRPLLDLLPAEEVDILRKRFDLA